MNRSFKSLGDLALHFDKLNRTEIRADRFGRTVVTKELSRDIKNRLGNRSLLQPDLAISTQRQRIAQGFTANDPLLRSGRLRKSIEYADVDPRTSGVGTDDPAAVYNEFGGTIPGRPPKRSFMASTFSENQVHYFAMFSSAFFRLLNL